MRLKEFDQSIQELSYTDPGIRKHLTKLGYKSAGEGGDQTTWLAPDDTILKIFGTHQGRQGVTKDQKMFEFWANYCKKNSGNPYLPKFSGWAQFEFPKGSGQVYLQIRMERLQEVPEGTTKSILDHMLWNIKNQQGFDSFKNLMTQKFGTKVVNTNPVIKTPELYNLVDQLYNIGNKNGWGLDLHGDNYMMRGKQIVIVDPWVASS